jgi:hypothetical protein
VLSLHVIDHYLSYLKLRKSAMFLSDCRRIKILRFYWSVMLCPCGRKCWCGKFCAVGEFALSVCQKHRPSFRHWDIGNRSDRNKQWGEGTPTHAWWDHKCLGLEKKEKSVWEAGDVKSELLMMFAEVPSWFVSSYLSLSLSLLHFTPEP